MALTNGPDLLSPTYGTKTQAGVEGGRGEGSGGGGATKRTTSEESQEAHLLAPFQSGL